MPDLLPAHIALIIPADGDRLHLVEQDMESAWFTRSDVEQMIRGGVLTDAKSIAAYALLLLH